MKKSEELQIILREVVEKFKKEEYEISLMKLEKAGKLIITSLNTYNKKK